MNNPDVARLVLLGMPLTERDAPNQAANSRKLSVQICALWDVERGMLPYSNDENNVSRSKNDIDDKLDRE